MKTSLLSGLLVLSLGLPARAALYSYSWSGLNAAIPDGNVNGYQNSQSLSGIPNTVITDVNVTFNLSGGYNGDLYVYLSHGSGLSVLLNRVGRSSGSSFGYGHAGFGPDSSANSFRFDDAADSDVHGYGNGAYTLYSSRLTGTWQPDGRNISPLASGVTFDSAARDNLLSVFNGANPNGTWTLYVADLSGGGQATLQGWGLEISAVPEPMHLALGGFGILFVGWAGLRRWWSWRRNHG
jgi:subtilisin-like proprotein convertase family protein